MLPEPKRQKSAQVLMRYRQALPQFVFDASALEGNPFTFPEVKMLMVGISVGGRKLSDENQVLNLSRAAHHLLDLIEQGDFTLSKATSDALHVRLAKEEALEWGHFRGQGSEATFTPTVSLGNFPAYKPLPTMSGGGNLLALYQEGLDALVAQVSNPLERGLAYFLFGALHQFYFDGNKRTARFMMNGVFMSHGLDAISVPAARAQEFNEKMVIIILNGKGNIFLY